MKPAIAYNEGTKFINKIGDPSLEEEYAQALKANNLNMIASLIVVATILGEKQNPNNEPNDEVKAIVTRAYGGADFQKIKEQFAGIIEERLEIMRWINEVKSAFFEATERLGNLSITLNSLEKFCKTRLFELALGEKTTYYLIISKDSKHKVKYDKGSRKIQLLINNSLVNNPKIIDTIFSHCIMQGLIYATKEYLLNRLNKKLDKTMSNINW